MRLRAALLLVALAAGPVGAQWKATKLPDGSYACRNADASVPTSYKGSAATIFCNGVSGGWDWLGTAQAQTLGFFRGQFPTGINVGSGPPLAPSLSSPWLQTDIGSPPTAGTAFDSQNVLTIQGSGDFHQATSAFHFVYQAKTGDWRVDFPITSLTGAGQYRSCGPAILDSLGVDVKYVYLTPSFATGKADFGGRTSTGAGVYETQTFSSADFTVGILRIEKIGSVFTGYMSTDGGMTFTQVGTSTWAPAGTFYIGVHDDSGEASTLSTCQGAMPTLTALSTSGPGTASFVTSAVTVSEAVGTMQICAQRAVDTSGSITVDIQNAGTGTAVAGTDFTNIFPATDGWPNGTGGQICTTLTVANRAGTQGSRTINLVLGNATGGVTIGSPSTMTITITDSAAIKTQPGWFGMINSSCYIGAGSCTTSVVLNLIATEICPNANIVGFKMTVTPAYLIGDTAGVYTGDANRGFTAVDQIVNALGACGKNLILQAVGGWFGDFAGNIGVVLPNFTYSTSGPGCASFIDCSHGTATGSNYGYTLNTQSSQPGFLANTWQNDWTALAEAAVAAYCTRYDSTPAFYAVGILFWNTSLPLAPPPAAQPAGYSEALFNNQYDAYLTAARAGCATTNILATLDYANPNPAQMSTHLVRLQTMHGAMANNDVWSTGNNGGFGSWGQEVFTGQTGSPSQIDYRGVNRYMEEVEVPDMCGSRQTQTPAQLFDVMQNGNAHQRPRWPSTIVVMIDSSCPPANNWAGAWKPFIASKSGMVMDGHGPTLKTPAAVKAICESSMVCQ